MFNTQRRSFTKKMTPPRVQMTPSVRELGYQSRDSRFHRNRQLHGRIFHPSTNDLQGNRTSLLRALKTLKRGKLCPYDKIIAF